MSQLYHYIIPAKWHSVIRSVVESYLNYTEKHKYITKQDYISHEDGKYVITGHVDEK